MYYYLTTNTNKNEPTCLRSITYVHVKARTDGDQTVIITIDPIVDDTLQSYTITDAQTLLDSWAQAENDAEVDPDIIHLSSTLNDFGTENIILWEQAALDRIARGYFSTDEANYFNNVYTMRDAFPQITQRFSDIEMEILFEKMKRIVEASHG